MISEMHVLVLEDEPVVAFLLEDMLIEAGAAGVTLASRISEARSAIAAGGVQAAVLDVNVHGEKSYEVADDLARLGVPFLFATGYGDREHPQRYAAAPTVTKPFSARDLDEAFARLESSPSA